MFFKRLKLLLLVNLFWITPIVAGKALTIQYWQTPQGAKVYFVSTPRVPILDVQLVFAAGSAYDGNNPGLAAVVNSFLGEHTTDLNGDQIANAFDSVGALFNTNLNRDMATISLRTLTNANYLNPALHTLIDVVGKTNFTTEPLQRIKNQLVASIKNTEQDPQALAFDTLFQTLYANHPYSHPVLGTMDSINKITTNDAAQFYKNFYVTNNAKLILVGDISRSQAESIATAILNAMPTGKSAPKLPMDNSNSNASNTIRIKFPSQQTSILLGQLGIASHSKDYFPLSVGNYIFGGLPLRSILFQEIREKRGMAYYAGSNFLPLDYRGPFEILLQTQPMQAANALKVVETAFNQFTKIGPTPEQLNAAKQYIIGSFPLKIDNNTDILNTVTDIAFNERPLNFLDNYCKNINAVTNAEIVQAFNRTLNNNKMIVVMVGPN